MAVHVCRHPTSDDLVINCCRRKRKSFPRRPKHISQWYMRSGCMRGQDCPQSSSTGVSQLPYGMSLGHCTSQEEDPGH